jgi:hypothetical protein
MDSACKSLRSTGLREQEVYPILNLIQHWIKNNGEEWTVDRLKLMKQGFINKLAYGKFSLREDSWISHDEHGPKGPFKILMNLKNPQKSLSAFMVYTSFISKRVTDKQWKKFHDAVTEPSQYTEMRRILSFDSINQKFSELPWDKEKKRFWTIAELASKQTRIPNHFGGYHSDAMKTVPMSAENLLSSFKHHLLVNWTASNLLVDRKGNLNEAHRATIHANYIGRTPMNVGVISLIQEPGYKLRAVANPLPAFQLALSSFGATLYSSLKNVPEDCTFDQSKGVQEIQGYMQKGGKLVAFDLSNATDRFPADLTFDMLEANKIGHPHDRELFKKVSRGKWTSPFGDVSWSNGQPLGLFPSFAAFALSHHALVRSVNPTFYRLLGDDIVIDKEHAGELKKAYDMLGCKISVEKSIDSDRLTEFAGRIITKDRVFIQPKFRDISDRSFLDLARNTGPTILGVLKPRQREVVKLLAEVPTSVLPLGLNWNPKGKPFNQRVEESRDVIDRLAQNDEKYLNVSSPTSKSLSDLGSDIVMRYHQDLTSLPFYGGMSNIHMAQVHQSVKVDEPLKILNKKIDELMKPLKVVSRSKLDFEGSLLRHLNVDRVESDRIIPGWSPTRVRESDPRGASLLTIIESKMYSGGINAPKPFKLKQKPARSLDQARSL